MSRSEGQLVKSEFYYLGSLDCTVRLGGICFYPLSHLIGPVCHTVFILYVQVFCLQYVYVLCGNLVSLNTKKVSNLQELELELVVIHSMGTGS